MRWVAAFLIATALAAYRAQGAPPTNPGLRTEGTGQIRFKGHGPEWWASRAHRLEKAVRGEQTKVDSLQRLLSSRLDRLVWLVRAFECIHDHEGAWDDTGDPYWGGLQMDWAFMRTYGRRYLQAKGPASNWAPAEQIAVAITAHTTRGFWPWPNTARMCGLLP